MKKLIPVIALLGLMLASCEVVVFQNPVPEDAEPLETIPEKFRGTYVFHFDDSNFGKLVIAEDHIESEKGTWFISDSMEVKKLGRDLVFNMQIKNRRSIKDRWVAVIVSPPRGGYLKTFQISSGLRQSDIDSGTDPKIVTEYGAEIAPNMKADKMVYLMRADTETLKKMLKDPDIMVKLVGKETEEATVIPSSEM